MDIGMKKASLRVNWFIGGLVIILTFLIGEKVLADPRPLSIPDITINNYYDFPAPAGTQPTDGPVVLNITNNVDLDYINETAAKAAACTPSFYMGTKRHQMTVQGAVLRGESALCLGYGKVLGDDADVMININMVPDEDDSMEDWLYTGGVLILF